MAGSVIAPVESIRQTMTMEIMRLADLGTDWGVFAALIDYGIVRNCKIDGIDYTNLSPPRCHCIVGWFEENTIRIC